MILNPGFPEQGARRRIHCIGIGGKVAEIGSRRRGASRWRHADRGSKRGVGRERPTGASALCVERVDLAITAANEHQASDNGRLASGAACAGKPKRPFQFQAGHLLRSQSCHRRRLKPAVADIGAPAVPLGPVRRLQKARCILHASSTRPWRSRQAGDLSGDERSDRRPLIPGSPLDHGCHAARGDRSQHRFERHRSHRAAVRRTNVLVAGIVALRAMLRIKRRAVLLRQRRKTRPDQHSRRDAAQFHGLSSRPDTRQLA